MITPMITLISTEEKIEKAALKEFALHGFEGGRIDRIARRGGVNKAMIYYYFKSKEALYESILSKMYDRIVERVMNKISKDKNPNEQLEEIITEFIGFIKDLEHDFVKMMLRELSSGGKYFKKLMLPKVILPMLDIVQDIFADGIKRGIFRKVIPPITFIQIVGLIVFPNLLRITLSDTDIGKVLFPHNFFDKFRTNLLTILKSGILVQCNKEEG
jgi:AcrR family transcriptional regulator